MDEFIVDLAELASEPRPRAEVGGKAGHLARLLAARLPVPAGVVIAAQAAELGSARRAELLAALPERVRSRAFAAPFAVRSSALLEDSEGAAAPGVFASVLHVSTAELARAVQRVWASANTELARAYAQVRSLPLCGIAVIIQQQVPPEMSPKSLAGTLYTRPPGEPSSAHMRIEIGFRGDRPVGAGADERISTMVSRSSGGERQTVGAGWPLGPDTTQRLCQLALDAERAIEASAGADVEWVSDGENLWIVQARPIVHPVIRPAPAFPAVLLAFSRAQPERLWRWDMSHNPEPLSAAQSGLVERMDRSGAAPYRLCVVGGYLYTSSDNRSSAPTSDELKSADAVRATVEKELIPELERALEPVAHLGPDGHTDEGDRPDLNDAIAAYSRFYATYTQRLTPVLGQAARVLPDFLARYPELDCALWTERLSARLSTRLSTPRGPSGVASEILRVARGQQSFAELMARVGAMAPIWDVACPTFAENPALLHRAIAAVGDGGDGGEGNAGRPATAALAARYPSEIPADMYDELGRCIAVAQAARELGELDDRLFARAQAAVRYALLAVARRWRLQPADDIFALPLEAVLSWHDHGHPPELTRVQRMARAGRSARERQRAWRPPLSFANGAPVASTHLRAERDTFTGRGIGVRVRGKAVRLEQLDEVSATLSQAGASGTDGAVVVAASVTPAMAVWMRGARALVAEYGDLLDHGAAMARELNIPCVVGCTGAWSDIRTGDELWVDGDAGTVVRIARALSGQVGPWPATK